MRAKMCRFVYCENSILYNVYIVSLRKQNDQFSLKGLNKMFFFSVKNVRFRFNKICKNVHLKLVFNPGTLKHYYG